MQYSGPGRDRPSARIDLEAKRQMEIVEEMVRLSRMHDRISTMRLLKIRFEEVDWDVVGLGGKSPPKNTSPLSLASSKFRCKELA